jgi:tetratricopeptide (TPR) repeat protein
VQIDFADTYHTPPGTPLEFVSLLISELEKQYKHARSFLHHDNPFANCNRVIDGIKIYGIDIKQTIKVKDGVASNVKMSVDATALEKSILLRLKRPFSHALTKLHKKSTTRTPHERPSKHNNRHKRPLIAITLDAVELAPRPLYEWLRYVPELYSRGNCDAFHVMTVAVGREKINGLIECELPPLTDDESTAFVREYIHWHSLERHDTPDKRKVVQPMNQSIARGLLQDKSLVAAIVRAGAGVPLMLSWLTELATINPQATELHIANTLPTDHAQRFRLVLERYLEYLGQAAHTQNEIGFRQRGRLLLVGAIPRQLPGAELLRAMITQLPDIPFGDRPDIEGLFDQLGHEAFVEKLPNGALRYHNLVRDGAIIYLKQKFPDDYQLLSKGAAEWYKRRGNQVEWLYHILCSDHNMAIEELRHSINSALEGQQWHIAQAYIDLTTHVELELKDQAWVTLFKADLAYGEGNKELALQRLIQTVRTPSVFMTNNADVSPDDLGKQVANRLELWLSWNNNIEGQSRDGKLRQVNHDYLDVFLWWAKHLQLPKTEAVTLSELARNSLLLGQWQKAEDFQLQALLLYRNIGYQLEEANALREVASIARLQRHLKEAEGFGQQALILYRKIESPLGEANALNELGMIAYQQDHLQEAEDLERQALALYRNIKSPLGEANALNELGSIASYRGHLQEAEDCEQRALTLYRNAESPLGEARALNELGKITIQQGRLKEAEGFEQRALTLYRNAESLLGEAHVLEDMGRLAFQQGRLKEAEGFEQQALTLYRNIKDQLGEANALYEIGRVAWEQNFPLRANQFLQQALTIYRDINSQSGEALVLLELGKEALKRQQFEEAKLLIDDAFSYYISIMRQTSMVRACLNIQNELLEQPNPEEYQMAVYLLKWVDQYATNTQYAMEVTELHKRLIEMHRG